MASIWSVLHGSEVESLDEMGDTNLDDSLWGYGEPPEAGSLNIWELMDLEQLFKLTKKGEKNLENFNTVRCSNRLEVARLPCTLFGETSIRILPKILEKVLQVLTDSFDQRDHAAL